MTWPKAEGAEIGRYDGRCGRGAPAARSETRVLKRGKDEGVPADRAATGSARHVDFSVPFLGALGVERRQQHRVAEASGRGLGADGRGGLRRKRDSLPKVEQLEELPAE